MSTPFGKVRRTRPGRREVMSGSSGRKMDKYIPCAGVVFFISSTVDLFPISAFSTTIVSIIRRFIDLVLRTQSFPSAPWSSSCTRADKQGIKRASSSESKLICKWRRHGHCALSTCEPRNDSRVRNARASENSQSLGIEAALNIVKWHYSPGEDHFRQFCPLFVGVRS